MLRVKDEQELRRYGLVIDPQDPSRAVAVGQLSDQQIDATTEPSPQVPPPESGESFSRETFAGDIAAWDDPAVTAGIRAECAEIRTLDRCYPGRYHRLGVLIIESANRFGSDSVRQMLRSEGINKTMAHWAVRIAELYTYEQAVQFESARAIIRTLPPKQRRKRTRKTTLDGQSDDRLGSPDKPSDATQPRATAESIIDEFIRLGERIKELLGDEALDAAVERIKTQAAETFEGVFAEV